MPLWTLGASLTLETIVSIVRLDPFMPRCRQPLVAGARGSQHEAAADRDSLPRPGSGSLIGTARYGPVRRVVWDPWLALRVSHGDPVSHFSYT
jgi:hypothetical protein